ncbi:MAG: nucleotidyltransferase family protein, partial [Firmicutes bacterium]|nr:nucleotidyltransferase family protein [Bacillota bacterium]
EALGKDPGPNDILALEYIRQAEGLGIHAVKRSGLSHHASASYIRENMGQIEDFVPEEAFFELSASKFWDEDAEKRLFEMIRYALMMKPSYELAEIMNISEGLENALKKAVDGATSIDDIIQGAKSKRYTYARISRALMCIVLDMNKELLAEAKESALYARVLAMNSAGAAILKNAKELNKGREDGFEIISNLKKTDVMLAKYKDIIETDIQAADLYTILTGNRVSDYSDFVQKPGIVI